MPSLYDLINNPDYIPDQSIGHPGYTAGPDKYTPNELPLIGDNKPSTVRRRFLENLVPTSLNVRNRGLLETLRLSGLDLGNLFTAPQVGRAARGLEFSNRGTREEFAARGLGGSGLEEDALMRNKEGYGRAVLEGERAGSEAENERQLNLMQQLFGVSQADLQFLTNLESGNTGQLRNVTGSGVGGAIGAGLGVAQGVYPGLKDLVMKAYTAYNAAGAGSSGVGAYGSGSSLGATGAAGQSTAQTFAY